MSQWAGAVGKIDMKTFVGESAPHYMSVRLGDYLIWKYNIVTGDLARTWFGNTKDRCSHWCYEATCCCLCSVKILKIPHIFCDVCKYAKE